MPGVELKLLIMKGRIIVIIAFAMSLLFGCKNGSESVAVYERVKAIYGLSDSSEYDDLGVYSESFDKLISDVEALDDKLISSGECELGYMNHDILSQSQDVVEFTGVTVINCNRKTAQVIVSRAGSFGPITLSMVKENGNWFIDDIDFERKYMTDYLKR